MQATDVETCRLLLSSNKVSLLSGMINPEIRSPAVLGETAETWLSRIFNHLSPVVILYTIAGL
jgi:hypothetical protein